MKKNSIKLNESQLNKIIAESVKRVLKEEDFSILSDGGSDFEQCYNDLDLYVENMTKEYSTETIISVLEKLLDFYKNA